MDKENTLMNLLIMKTVKVLIFQDCFPGLNKEVELKNLKKILVQLERKPEEGKLVQAYYYKGKEEVAKELMNDEEEDSMGCIQQ